MGVARGDGIGRAGVSDGVGRGDGTGRAGVSDGVGRGDGTGRAGVSDGVVRAEAGRLLVGGTPVPLIAGEVQFWRMDPATWRPALERVAGLDVPIVSTYLSWRRHEPSRGAWDWGTTDPRLDARRFLELCHELGRYVHLKPGPWICAEEVGGGYPDWLLATPGIAALDAAGRPVIGYNPPFRHVVPSPHDERYRAAAREWLGAVWTELGDLRFPDGPVIAVQLDNEPSLCFRDALYAADYHPDAVAAFRRWLAVRYGSDPAGLRRRWGPDAAGVGTFDEVEPPRPPVPARAAGAEATRRGVPAAIRDWTAFTGDALAEHLTFLEQVHHDLGAANLLATVNIINHPVHDVPLREATLRSATGALAGVDQYYEPPVGWEDITRLALGAATARAAGEPVVWSPELMAGIWRSPGERVDYPDPTPVEQAVWWGAAQALGYQGFTAYMLVDRENWEHAPVGADGAVSPFAGPLVDLTARRRSAPGLAQAAPVPDVLVAWHHPDAVAAYASTGTAAEPDVPWADAGRLRAYRSWTAVLARLLEAGLTFDLWDTGRPERPVPGSVVVVPAGSGVGSAVLDAWRDGGCVVVEDVRGDAGDGGDVPGQLVAAGLTPAIEVLGEDGRRAERVLAVLHRAVAHDAAAHDGAARGAGDLAWAHLVSWGPAVSVCVRLREPGVAALVDVLSGERRPVGDEPWLLTPGHHVLAVEPGDPA